MKRLLTCMLLSTGIALTASAAVSGPIPQVRANGGPAAELGNVIRRDGTQSPVKATSTTTLTNRTHALKVPKLNAASAYNATVETPANGDPLYIGEPYFFSEGSNSEFIRFADNLEKVLSPHVVLDRNEGYLSVAGDDEEQNFFPELYLRGSFNDWGVYDEYRMTRDDVTGIYTLKSVTFPQGDYMFKIASSKWEYQYGVWSPTELIPGEPLSVDYAINGGGYLETISATLSGTYDVTLYPNELILLFKNTETEKPAINYSDFDFYCGGQYKYSYALEATDVKNRYIVHDVPMTDNCYFYLFTGVNGYQYYALQSEGYSVTPDGTATLNYWNINDGHTYLWYMGCDGFDGIYDVTIDFNGETADITFKRTGELVFNPEKVVMVFYDAVNDTYWGNGFPKEIEGHTAVYKNICLSGEHYIYFSDMPSGHNFGQSDADIKTLSPDNMSVDLLLDGPSSIIPISGCDGVYELTLVYNEDFTRATATLSPRVVPDAISTYDGDLYITGAITEWQYGNPDYKMICIEPGIYEWSGDRLVTSFIITGEDYETKFPETDVYIELGGYRYPSDTLLIPGEPFNLTFQGYDVRFADGIETLENVKVTVNLRDMTLLVTEEPVVPKLHLNKMVLYIPDNGRYYGKTQENGVFYTNIPFYPGYSYVEFACEGTSFGWPENLEGLHVVTDESPTTIVVRDPEAFVPCTLDGFYNVLVEFNDAQTEGNMTVTRVSEPPAFDLSEMYLLSSNEDWYEPTVVDDGIVYHNVRVEPGMGFGVLNNSTSFGWKEPDENNVPWITEEDPETTLYSSFALGTQVFYALAFMEGYFDVYVTFNSDFTEATMRFEKTGELYAYINVTIDNGTKFTVRSRFGGTEYLCVGTDDHYWLFTGVDMNGEVIKYEYPNSQVETYVQIPENDNLNIRFFMEYIGECQILESTVGAEVTFDNNIVISRVAEGVEVRNLELGEEIAVYTLGGQMITLVKAQKDAMTIKLEKGQTFIVRAGNVAAKVVM